MDPSFRSLTEQLDAKFRLLMQLPPIVAENVPNDTPVGGVYLFTENDVALYAGRTKRKLGVRIRNHFSTAPDCPFAWLLAREITGFKPTYRTTGSRKELLTRPDFFRVYQESNYGFGKCMFATCMSQIHCGKLFWRFTLPLCRVRNTTTSTRIEGQIPCNREQGNGVSSKSGKRLSPRSSLRLALPIPAGAELRGQAVVCCSGRPAE